MPSAWTYALWRVRPYGMTSTTSEGVSDGRASWTGVNSGLAAMVVGAMATAREEKATMTTTRTTGTTGTTTTATGTTTTRSKRTVS